MGPILENEQKELLRWCETVLGPLEPGEDFTREHPGQRAAVHLLRARSGSAYLKVHRDPAHWASEVHAYEHWAPAFGSFAPRLLGVREVEPLAVLVSDLPGTILEGVSLPSGQEQAAWRSAGQALASLHALTQGSFFGPCRRDGSALGSAIAEAREYVTACLEDWLERGLRGSFLSQDEQAALRAARGLIPAFEGEPALPCHRDYCPANWLVLPDGRWSGVVDFEFAYWDVRASDFSRYPGWNWIARPDLNEAFFEGYGLSPSPAQEEQILFARLLYALGAVVWGMENDYFGFAREGRQAMRILGRQV